jgi:hypothetical protein
MTEDSGDPRRLATFHVGVLSRAEDAELAKSIADALLDVPAATDEDVARLAVSIGAGPETDAYVVVAPHEPPVDGKAPVFHVERSAHRDVEAEPAARSFALGPGLEGIDVLRAALLEEALRRLGISVERIRKAKRPYATGIIAGAALMAGAEGILPGAAAFVVGTQVSAIASLHYLYTGKWVGRGHIMALLPVFASEAAGGSLVLLVKSLLPPTGVGEFVAVVVAASMTVAMLGAVAGLLEQGYTLDETEKLRQAFERMNAKTKAERANLVRDRHRWRDKTFVRDLVRRLVFE